MEVFNSITHFVSFDRISGVFCTRDNLKQKRMKMRHPSAHSSLCIMNFLLLFLFFLLCSVAATNVRLCKCFYLTTAIRIHRSSLVTIIYISVHEMAQTLIQTSSAMRRYMVRNTCK